MTLQSLTHSSQAKHDDILKIPIRVTDYARLDGSGREPSFRMVTFHRQNQRGDRNDKIDRYLPFPGDSDESFTESKRGQGRR